MDRLAELASAARAAEAAFKAAQAAEGAAADLRRQRFSEWEAASTAFWTAVHREYPLGTPYDFAGCR
jgi:cation transport regulator ChaB